MKRVMHFLFFALYISAPAHLYTAGYIGETSLKDNRKAVSYYRNF